VTKRPQAGNDAREVGQLRVPWRDDSRRDYLTDALTLLSGWSRDDRQIKRVFQLDDAQHAALTERISVVADALQLRPSIRRLDGYTQIMVSFAAGGGLTAGEVTLAARIEDAYRTVIRPL
jgi:pterin-4a-carbinolamine dehydratase